MNDTYLHEYSFIFPIGVNSVTVNIRSSARKVLLKAPSGTGKSTFVKILAGIGKKYHGYLHNPFRRVGYVPQDCLLIPTMTVYQNLVLSPHTIEKNLTLVCESFSVSHLLSRHPRALSGGEKQRVAIARALLADPDLLIFDEPFSALDETLKTSITNFLGKWIDTHNLSLILISHDDLMCSPLCEEVWCIKENSLTAVSPTSHVL